MTVMLYVMVELILSMRGGDRLRFVPLVDLLKVHWKESMWHMIELRMGHYHLYCCCVVVVV